MEEVHMNNLFKKTDIFYDVSGPTPGLNLNSIASPIPTLPTADPLSHLYHNYAQYGLCKFNSIWYPMW